MNDLIQILSKIDWPTLIAMGGMMWLFYNRIDGKIEKLDNKLSEKIEKLDERLSEKIEKLDERLSEKIQKVDERLSEKIEDIDRRLCRIEGALTAKDCCVLKSNHENKQII